MSCLTVPIKVHPGFVVFRFNLDTIHSNLAKCYSFSPIVQGCFTGIWQKCDLPGGNDITPKTWVV